MLEILDLGKKKDCTFYVAKTMALLSCTVTVQLICVLIFRICKKQVSDDGAHINMYIHHIKHILNLKLPEHFKTLEVKGYLILQ